MECKNYIIRWFKKNNKLKVLKFSQHEKAKNEFKTH